MTKDEVDLAKAKIELEILEQNLEIKRLEASKIKTQRRGLATGTITIIVALIGVIGSIITHFLQQSATQALEKKKFEYGLYTQALDAKNKKSAAIMLDSFIEFGLLEGEKNKYISYYLDSKDDLIPSKKASYPTVSPPTAKGAGKLLIQNDFLVGQDVSYNPSPNHSGKLENTKIVVVHYSSAKDFKSSVESMQQPKARESVHIIIGRNGEISQLVPFSQIAWHAGKSEWKDIKGLNRYSFGIMFDNAGKLTKSDDNDYVSWFGQRYPKEQVITATYKGEKTPSHWHKYTDIQITRFNEVIELLKQNYGVEEIIGHSDITKHRKQDPGPAFPISLLTSGK